MIDMAVNKVVYGTTVLVDLTQDSVTPEALVEGYTAHGADGAEITGSFTLASEMSEQDTLIALIKAALQNKAGGGETIDLSVELAEQRALIDAIKEALNGKAGVGSVDIYDANQNPVERGSISSTAGEDTAGTTRLRTKGYIPVKPNSAYKITTNIDNVYVIQLADDLSVTASSGWKSSPYVFATDQDCAYIRLTLAKKSNGNIYVTDFESLAIEYLGG